jgi:hypothetical protein
MFMIDNLALAPAVGTAMSPIDDLIRSRGLKAHAWWACGRFTVLASPRAMRARQEHPIGTLSTGLVRAASIGAIWVS